MSEASKGAVVVTGGAGALGAAVLAEFGARGREVIVLDRPGERLEGVAARTGVHTVPVDLGDRADVAAAFRRVDELAPVNALVALAGGFKPGSLAETTPELLDSLWRSNFASVLWCCQAAAPRLAEAGGGTIVTVGSKTAREGKAPVAHATSKAAVLRLTELLAAELRPQRIRVNAVLPSVIDTPANRAWMSEDLARRAVSPAAIATVIGFLSSEDSAPTSGASIPVYGDA
jgi:NAD(P)-dependent dehydrogenase (short-subunit alcohol dehydrogenase family)